MQCNVVALKWHLRLCSRTEENSTKFPLIWQVTRYYRHIWNSGHQYLVTQILRVVNILTLSLIKIYKLLFKFLYSFISLGE